MLHLLDEIAARLATDDDALGLLALGSSGLHLDRMDEHSDLDFFVIAADKEAFLGDLSWLGQVAWSHRDTPDGCKALVQGVYCEFAVFRPEEMPSIMFERGRIVWQRHPLELPEQNVPQASDTEWLVNEVLSNLYVGLHRWLRGEKLSAMRFIQGQALDNLLRLYGATDPFTPSRRAEHLGLALAPMAGGYEASGSAAQAIFEALPPGGGAMRAAVAALLPHRERP